MQNKLWFIAGIDTDCGKTVATGELAAYLQRMGVRVVTQKLVQTGSAYIAEDILAHRKAMGVGPLSVDLDHTTCPYVFEFPASPHLSARLEGQAIDVARIDEASRKLESMFDLVLLEGAGGLHVPIRQGYHSLDFVQERNYPVVLVSSSRLGSINHTLLSLEVLHGRGIELKALIYNHYPAAEPLIVQDTLAVLCAALADLYPKAALYELPTLQAGERVDFEGLACID